MKLKTAESLEFAQATEEQLGNETFMINTDLRRGALVLFVLLLVTTAHAQFTFTTNYGALTITGYSGPGGEVVIPSSTNGLPVTTVGGSAFSNQVSVTSVTIPNSVTTIANRAFQSCSSLANLAIPDSVVSISYYAFVNCVSLTNVTLPSTLPSIDTQTFYGCTKLTSLVVPDSVTDMGNGTFRFCSSLASIVIPNGVTFIGNAEFADCTSLTSVVVPGAAAYIGYTAFTNCTSLRSVIIAHGVTNIGNRAFAGCSSLTNLVLPKSLSGFGTYVFKSCGNLKEIYFKGNAPRGDTTVFNGVTNATVYYLPGTTGWGTNYLGLPTVLWKPRLETGGSPNGTNQFGFNIVWTSDMAVVVEACTNLADPVWFPLQTNILTADTNHFSDPTWTSDSSRYYRVRWTTVPTQTGDYLFEINDGEITITKYLGPGGNVTIPETILGLPVTRIGNEAFRSVTSLTNISIPDSVTIIGSEAFRYCYGLTQVNIPRGVVNIGNNIFSYDTNLTAITVGPLNPVYSSVEGVLFNKSQTTLLQCPGGKAGSYIVPDTVIEIGTRAFWSCTGLTNVTVANSVLTIGQASFRHCSRMVRLTVSENLDWFLNWAVADCTSLKGVYFLGNAPYLDGPDVFTGDPATAYYLSGTTGWGPTYGGLPTALWQP